MKTSIGKRLVALTACCALACGGAVAAQTVTKNITVEYSGIKLVVDGVEVTPRDANGSVVEPFVYNGTTYLPVRAVGNAIGKEVGWDGETQTVYLGEVPNSSSWLMSVCPPYDTFFVETPSTFQMSGETYAHGLTFKSTKDGYALFNLNGKYSTLSCDIGHVDGTDSTDGARFEIYLDGELSQVIEVDGQDLVKHFDIPLKNALQLKIVRNVETDYYWGEFGIANAELK